MRIASFNINGIKARLPRLIEWLDDFSPDVAALQEIKSIDENFPREALEQKGWHVETHGQKGFNGVALLSKHAIDDVFRGLPGTEGEPDPDIPQARYIEGTIKGTRIASLYLPNGNPQPGPKFDFKLGWMNRLLKRAQYLLTLEIPVVLAGDYNVIPTDEDCYNSEAWVGDALTQPESRSRFNALKYLGYLDAIRQIHPNGQQFTYWDYQRGAWEKDNGIRIDHLLLSPGAADQLTNAGIDKKPRGLEKPSDHTPVWCDMTDDHSV